MAYLNTKNYQEAITYLDKFESEDEALAPMAKGAIGDALCQLDEKEDALDYISKQLTYVTMSLLHQLIYLKQELRL